MNYKSGYKYIVAETCVFKTRITLDTDIGVDNYLILHKDGTLVINKGYAWNGVNWWPDTKKNMSAGLVHDALYQLIQEGVLALAHKDNADLTFRDMLEQEGDISAPLCFWAVQKLGIYFTKPSVSITV